MRLVKKALKLEIYILVGMIACFLVSALLGFFADTMFSKEVGYTVYELNQNGEYSEVETVYYADGDKGEVKDLAPNQKIWPIKEEMSHGKKVFSNIFIYAVNLLIFYFCIYLEVNGIGRKARFSNEIDKADIDKFESVKIGLLADIPFVIFYIGLIVCRLALSGKQANTAFIVFKALNIHNRPLIDLLTNFTYTMSGLSVGDIALISITLVVIPVLTIVAYRFGYSNGEIVNSWIYKD